ncbi:RNA polymerase sigma factor [Catalinimonas niigatensis]|uniref:RNA polymerase sigma factor n=1 Tax=Catalinimonas niigatensis TaxID=1397264 RepID=UPI002666FA50|nr:sigma-70 family RNA polymerase sigma factor [Catalinimonas niigatensis]WPP50963.1 sigma-70 family RNA polymerase sigma factor [Catalinimonas niigatensis]
MNLRLTYSKIEDTTTAALTENDQQLWEEFRLGNQQALSIMYQKHFFKLYNYGLKITHDADLVKDCIQELFIHIWKQRKTLSATTSIKYYLFKALRRKIVEEIKKNKLTQSSQQEYLDFVFELPHEEKIIQLQISDEQKAALVTCLNKLPKRQKEALFLRYYENMTPQEVSSIMSLSIDSTYVLFSKALHFMRKHMPKIISSALPFFFC